MIDCVKLVQLVLLYFVLFVLLSRYNVYNLISHVFLIFAHNYYVNQFVNMSNLSVSESETEIDARVFDLRKHGKEANKGINFA